MRAEARAAICAANDVEHYGRQNNIRVWGLKVDLARSAVTEFLNEKLQMDIVSEDIKAAHILLWTYCLVLYDCSVYSGLYDVCTVTMAIDCVLLHLSKDNN